MHIVESNAEKTHVQDLLVREDVAEMVKESLLQGEGGWVFVCANEQAAKDVRVAFEQVLGSDGVDETFMRSGVRRRYFDLESVPNWDRD